MPHDHHDHAAPADADDQPLTYWQQMEIAIRALLIEKGVATAAEINAQIATMDARSPAAGAALVARVWTDPDFRAAVLADASAASRMMGFDIGALRLIAVENTQNVHNLITCTLCSCYPRNLLGLPPDWYKSRAYRSRAVKEPRKVLAEFGLTLPDSTQIRVHDSTADMRYIVIPARPAGTDGWSRDDLAALVGRDAMIGTALAAGPTPK
jgi:nitrile hydratase subunit alpha